MTRGTLETHRACLSTRATTVGWSLSHIAGTIAESEIGHCNSRAEETSSTPAHIFNHFFSFVFFVSDS